MIEFLGFKNVALCFLNWALSYNFTDEVPQFHYNCTDTYY